MEPYYLLILSASVAFVLGYFLGGNARKGKNKALLDEARREAKELLQNAKLESESIKKEKKLQAKEHFIELKSNHEREIYKREQRISEIERRLKKNESKLQNEVRANDVLRVKLEKEIDFLGVKQDKLKSKEALLNDKLDIQIQKLEEISKLSAEDAKNELMETLKEKAKSDAMSYAQQHIEEAKLTAQQEAKKIVISTIQRIGTEEAIYNCVSIFNLESDDVKGRIIGREGRNIRVLEAETGVEIIVDDTPEAIILSCFDPVRREIARLSLHRLVSDGRIHPARIEEVVKKTQRQIENEII